MKKFIFVLVAMLLLAVPVSANGFRHFGSGFGFNRFGYGGSGFGFNRFGYGNFNRFGFNGYGAGFVPLGGYGVPASFDAFAAGGYGGCQGMVLTAPPPCAPPAFAPPTFADLAPVATAPVYSGAFATYLNHCVRLGFSRTFASFAYNNGFLRGYNPSVFLRRLAVNPRFGRFFAFRHTSVFRGVGVRRAVVRGGRGVAVQVGPRRALAVRKAKALRRGVRKAVRGHRGRAVRVRR